MGCTSLASEFPNDNAEISGGGFWVCESLTGPATFEPPLFEAPVLTPPTFAPVVAEPFVLWFDDDEGYVDGPVELELSDGALSVAVHAPAAEQAPVALEDAPVEDAPIVVEVPLEAGLAPAFAHFESALTAALMAQGASRSAALVPKLLRLETLPGDALAKDVQLTLQSRGYLDGHGRYSQKYRDLCGAWSAVLHGSSQDFAACGTTTLDRFGAELLAALLAVPATRADELRRELRKAGIAAFGVLEAA
ncbi:MAG TPA: hypothetical protein VHB79_15580 [Polyangiaceae bacterium]|nr:hypothetical protein [Polyangiaceae bacterium]